MNARSQIVSAWCGILCPLIFFGGLYFAGFFPPLPPSLGAEETAAFYQDNTIAIRIGALIMMISSALFIPFTAVLSAQIRRMEHRLTPVLSYTQLAAGALVVILFFLPALFWTIAAFRPDRPAAVTQALNDMAWICLLMPFMLAAAQNLAIAFAILNDKRAEPVFPRWVGFLNIWIALMLAPGGLITFFKLGPFAWNGLLGFWVPVCGFGPWFFVLGYYLIKAARRQEAIGE